MKTWKMVLICSVLMLLIGFLGSCNTSDLTGTKRVRAKEYHFSKNYSFVGGRICIITVDTMIRTGDTVIQGTSGNMRTFIVQD
jgi:hypothetical protein